MAKKNHRDDVGLVVAEVEAMAKRLRREIRMAVPKDLKRMAARLRKQAAHAAEQVEKYVHEIRVALEKPAVKRRVVKRPHKIAA